MAPIVLDAMQDSQQNGLTRKELLEQLERIVSSTQFRNSKRYPSFLRFIVERTVEDNTEILKERNLGIEVFGRPSDYDTSADPIVRVTAGEVRKRIAQYYQASGHEHELRIDLPLGSYVPHFHPAGHAPGQESEFKDASLPSQDANIIDQAGLAGVAGGQPKVQAGPVIHPGLFMRQRLGLGLYIIALFALIAGSVFGVSALRSRSRSRGIDYFWQSFAPGNSSALIVMGVHFSDGTGKALPADPGVSVTRNEQQTALSSMVASDMIPVSDVVSYSKITDLLTRRSVTYRTRSSTDTTLDALRLGPVVLIGGFNNVWTMRFASRLRYRLIPKTDTVNTIEDSQHPATFWAFNNLQPAIGNSKDYAIVASYYDSTIEQHVVIAAGIGKGGTVAATEFLTSENYLRNWLTDQKLPANKNVELVLSTDVLDGESGPPHVIAVSIW